VRLNLAIGVKANAKDKEEQKKLCAAGPVPDHIAIIMDGNGRWAKERGKSRVFGHREGVRSVRDIVEACGQVGVKNLTLYAFSTENWKRPIDEVSMLMRLLVSSLKQEINSLHKNGVRLNVIGEMPKLPKEAQAELLEAIDKTSSNTGLMLTLALSYSGRWDITRAMKRVALDVRNGKISPEDVNEDTISKYLSTASIPDPDLLIRTSGEFRISNFLLWQLAYTEIYIGDCFWPEFRRTQLYEAIKSFQSRERRFGLVSEQIDNVAKRNTLKDELINVFSSY
jgi:undecaprenyl diphosphate synthase